MNTIYLLQNNINLYPYIIYDDKCFNIEVFDNIKYILVDKCNEVIIKYVENHFEIISIIEVNDFIKYELNRNICKIEITDGINKNTYELTDHFMKKIDYFLFYLNNPIPDNLLIELEPEEYQYTIYMLSRYIYKKKIGCDFLGLPLEKEFIILEEPHKINMYLKENKITLSDILTYMNKFSIIEFIDDIDILAKMYILFAKKICNNMLCDYAFVDLVSGEDLLSILDNLFIHACEDQYNCSHFFDDNYTNTDSIFTENFDVHIKDSKILVYSKENIYLYDIDLKNKIEFLDSIIIKNNIIFVVSEVGGAYILFVIKLDIVSYNIINKYIGGKEVLFIANLENLIYFNPFIGFQYDLKNDKHLELPQDITNLFISTNELIKLGTKITKLLSN